MTPEIQYQFLIDGVEVEEPVSWDGEEFIIKRSEEYFGLENAYSTTLKFWEDGASIIRDKYNIQGIEAQLTFVIRKSCDRGATWATIIDGILNCANYTYLNGEVTVMMEESSFNRTFKNRMDTVVSLSATESIDGNSLSDIGPRTITTRSKAIVQYSKLLANPALLDISESFTFSTSPAFNVVFFPLQKGPIQDIENTQELSQFFYFAQGPYASFAPPIFVNANTSLLSNITVRYKLKGTFINDCPDNVEYNYSLVFNSGSTATDNPVWLVGTPPFGDYVSGTGANGFDFDVEGEFDIAGSTEKLWLRIALANYRNFNSLSPNPSLFRLVLDAESYIEFSTESVFPDTESDVFLVHEAFAKITEVITGQKDSFKSEYFGAGDSQPRQYPRTGCQRQVSITNGLNLRNMLQQDGSKFPVNLSFSQLYKMLDSIFCLGMRLEYDDSEKKWFVRVENREYFYSNQTLLEFDAVSDITVKSDLSNYYNGVSIGYKKWQLNNGQTNGLDEFNTGREYVILNKNANKKLEIKSDAIAGGYPIEFTRRQQFSQDTTKDFETDNDIFVICLNRTEVTYDSTVYQAGYINEANELFPSISNLISPSTAYNLRISPARNLYRWLRFVKCSLHKKEDKVIKFSSGEGNYLLKSTSSHECDAVCEMDESADFEGSSNCFSEAGLELISPESIEFEIPFDFSIFGELLGNSNRAIRVNCSNQVIYKGFLGQVSFKPNQAEGGTAQFTLTTTPSSGAAFDEGFSDGFDSIP